MTSINIVGCSNSPKSSPYIDSGNTGSTESPKPIKKDLTTYDVICFIYVPLGMPPMCQGQIYKIPRSSTITVTLEQSTTVQSGVNNVIRFRSSSDSKEKISESEMEYLSENGSNIYGLLSYYKNESRNVKVVIFDRSIGQFRNFDTKPTQVIFKAGEKLTGM